MPRTKIICTIGPKSQPPEILERLIRAGMNVARLNFSHGTQSEHGEVITEVRSISKRLGYPVAILQDLAGPKIRIGEIEGGSITLESGETFILTNRQVKGNKHEVSITYPDLPKEIQPGDTLLLSDGALELEVLQTDGTDIESRVIIGGPLSSHKGINLPTRSIRASSFTNKDKNDLAFGIEQEVDYVALSFVRAASDILEVRRFIEDRGCDIPIIAKIEKHEALEKIDEIIEAVDGIMVARGDLGVEIPLEKVPLVQKMLIEKSNRAGKPVITATQMLRSMVDNPRPTRAEVTDVANAILDGTDAVMLSEETAMGNYPVEAVEMMAKIAEDAELGFPYHLWIYRFESKNVKTVPEAVSHAACSLAENIDASSIVTFTYSGSTARLVSKYRPRRPILALTPLEKTYRQLALTWGVTPILGQKMNGTDKMIEKVTEIALKSGLTKRGERVVITAGLPLGVPGTTNLIKAVMLN
ncbi:MAG TPA: pyruvate kinase [Thermodesulfobacteriota bacterium]|nr:pyruvate kinase [Thermodesulfobacteriota bacterium]